MSDSLKQKLRRKQTTIGSWISYDYEATTEFMAKSGFEWLVIDMEHTATSVADMARLIRVIDLAGCLPIVRVGANDPLLIKRALDIGAKGIIVPMICSAVEAEAFVSSALYPPRGNRGVGLFRAQGYGTSFEEYKKWVGEELVLIAQIEHWKGVDEIEKILAIPEIDGFFVGPYDLSGSVGRPGDFENPDFKKQLERLEAVAKASPKSSGIHIVHPDAAGKQLAEKTAAGYSFIAYGTDMIFFTSKVGESAKAALRK